MTSFPFRVGFFHLFGFLVLLCGLIGWLVLGFVLGLFCGVFAFVFFFLILVGWFGFCFI